MAAIAALADLFLLSSDQRLSQAQLDENQRAAAGALSGYRLIDQVGGSLELAEGVEARDLALFSRLVEVYRPDLRYLSLKDCPACFCTGMVELTRGGEEGVRQVVAAGGQGGSAGKAALACLGELAERISLFSLGLDDPRVTGFDDRTNDLKLGPFLGFSSGQECYLQEQNPGLNPLSGDCDVPWNRLSQRRVSVKDLQSGASAQLPAFGALFGERTYLEMSVSGLLSSSGTAVWSDLDTATQKAVFELAERDAFAQAWYNRLGITRVPQERWGDFLPEKMSHFLSGRSRLSGLYRIGTDLRTHVVAAISHDANGLSGCLGVAASHVAADAAYSAVLEMLQGELSLELAALAYRADRVKQGSSMPRALTTAGNLRIADDLGLADLPHADIGALRVPFDPADLEASCRERGIELWRFDATHPDLNIPCARVLSAQMCSWQPRFGKQRLFSGVVDRGLAGLPGLEAEFASRPFPF
jgi:ribosomal protein S12 methylthiotransferase accessory factor